MRTRSAVTLLLIALMTAPPVSVNGQEEPLPAVTPRADALIPIAELPAIVLAVEPIRDFHQPTLLEAARANDYATFDALYREAKARGEAVGAYDTLHELWTYSVTDPIGAFYGRDFYERLARAYPGYARYIDDYRIVDDRGAVFYPTSETRAFLMDRIVEGNAPRVLLASSDSARSTVSSRASSEGPGRAATRSATPRTTRRATSSTGSSAPATTAATKATATGDRQNAGGPAGLKTSAPVTAAAPPVTAPVTTAPAVPAPVVTETPAVVIRPTDAAPAPAQMSPAPAQTAVTEPAPTQQAPAQAAQAEAQDNGLATRGILLLVLGVIGIGLLALMLRASDEKRPKSIINPESPVTPFDPNAKRPAAPGPQAAPAPPKNESNRATGSHG